MANKSIVTPSGQAHYPSITVPNTMFNADGVYKCDLIVSEDKAEEFTSIVQQILDKEYDLECQRKGKKLRKAANFPVFQDSEGTWMIRAKQPAKVTSKDGKSYDFSIKVFDAQGKLVTSEDLKIGNGSVLKMAVEPRTWFNPSLGFGITLGLRAVQIIELVEYTGGSADFGFGTEEGSFVAGGESFDDTFSKNADSDSEEEGQDGDF